MQTAAQRHQKIILIAMLVVGSFALYTPVAVNAAHSGAHAQTMAEMSMPENSGCLKQLKCPQQSSPCEQYCVRRSTERTAVAATTTIHHRIFAAVLASEPSFDDFVKIGRMLARPDRSPPGHQFLRSVIKRE